LPALSQSQEITFNLPYTDDEPGYKQKHYSFSVFLDDNFLTVGVSDSAIEGGELGIQGLGERAGATKQTVMDPYSVTINLYVEGERGEGLIDLHVLGTRLNDIALRNGQCNLIFV
jgi:hypothetical protein